MAHCASRLWVATLARPLAERLVAGVLRPGHGDRCLDMPCGSGGLSGALAAAVGPRGRVLAADSLAEARAACAAEVAALGLETVEVGDGPGPSHPPFDIAASLLTLPHRDAPERLLEASAGALRQGGRLAAAVWGDANSAPPVAAVAEALAGAVGERLDELEVALRRVCGDGLARLARAAGLDDAEMLRLADVVRFDGPDRVLVAVAGLYGLEPRLEALNDVQLATALQILTRRLSRWTAADGTLVFPVELSVLSWVKTG